MFCLIFMLFTEMPHIEEDVHDSEPDDHNETDDDDGVPEEVHPVILPAAVELSMLGITSL